MKAKPPGRALASPPNRLRWQFRVFALCLPVVLLVVTELALRIFGYGHETKFFICTDVGGQEVLTDNAKFGWRFFPPLIARTPEPVMMPARKEPGACRIFVFGESAAMGDPDPAVGLPRMLGAMLEEKFPQKKFEVVNVAMTAINSHVMREIAKECARLDGDFWLVYAGNNEVVGPFGGGTVFGPQVPPLGWIRFTLWFKTTRIGQLLSMARNPTHAEWEGMEMFLKQQVRHDDPRLQKVYANFRENLSDIVRLGSRAGAKVIVSTVAVNLRDCPPFASQHRRPMNAAEETNWNQRWTNGLMAEISGDAHAAASRFTAAGAVLGGHDSYAELKFHLGRLAEAAGRREEARREFNAAKEFDTLRFRADDALNGILRGTSNRVTAFVDAEARLGQLSSNQIAGAEFFYEHVHFTFDGNYALARLFFEEIVKRLPPEEIRGAREGVPTRDECAKRLCWNEWKQREVFQEVRKRLEQPPFTAQFGHAAREADWRRRIDQLSQMLTPQRVREIAHEYEAVLRRATNDWVLHEDCAKLLTEIGDHTNAIAHWRAVVRLLPHDATPFFYLGSAADELGLTVEAITAFRGALRRDPNMVEAYSALGLSLVASGHAEAGKRELRRAVQIRPRFAPARVNLGRLLAEEGNVAEAREQYEAALHADTNNAAAHLNLGKLLSASGDKVRAVEHYREVLRIDSRNAVAHFNLGNALQGSARDEAVMHYRAAVTIDPAFAEARYSLALELGKANDVRESLTHFAEYVKLRPDSAEGHLNYGVALAKSRRFSDAAREFRETLRINPTDAKARDFLEKAKLAGGL